MQALFHKAGNVLVVRLIGQIDFESADLFDKAMNRRFFSEKLIFNMEKLSFVGSSGLTPFVGTIIRMANMNRHGISICGLSTEFRRMIETRATRPIRVFHGEHDAIRAHQIEVPVAQPVPQPQAPAAPPEPEVQSYPAQAPTYQSPQAVHRSVAEGEPSF